MITSKGNGMQTVDELIKALKEQTVFVGVPEEETSRESDTVTNSQLAFLHTNGVRSASMRNEMNDSGLPYSQAFQAYIADKGSPLWKIPPRPILEPALEHEPNRKLIQEQMGVVVEAFAKSKEEGQAELDKLGLLAQGIVRDWFDNPANGWPPNADYTIEQKGSDRPLINTGQLRNSMNYVIRKE